MLKLLFRDHKVSIYLLEKELADQIVCWNKSKGLSIHLHHNSLLGCTPYSSWTVMSDQQSCIVPYHLHEGTQREVIITRGNSCRYSLQLASFPGGIFSIVTLSISSVYTIKDKIGLGTRLMLVIAYNHDRSPILHSYSYTVYVCSSSVCVPYIC